MKPGDTVKVMVERVTDPGRRPTASDCFGQPVATEAATVIPAARVGYCFGLGFGGGEGEVEEGGGGGTGGSGSATPVALVELGESGVRVHPVRDETRLGLALLGVVAWNAYWALRTVRSIWGGRADEE